MNQTSKPINKQVHCYTLYSIFLYIWIIFITGSVSANTDSTNAKKANADSSILNPFEQVIKVLDFKNTDLKDVIRILATKYNINVLVENNVNKRLTLHLVNVKLKDVLEFIVKDNGLVLKKFGNIYKIMNPPIPAPPPKEWKITYAKELLSVDLQNEDIQEALRQIAYATGKTILPDRHISGHISGMINSLPFEEGLSQLLKSNGYYLRKKKDVYLIKRMNQPSGKGNQKASGDFWINAQKGVIDIEVHNGALSQILEEIAVQTNINFFLLDKPKGTINARANGLSLEKLLNLILMENNYTYKKMDGVYIIGAKNNRELSSSRLIKLKHLKVDGIQTMLPRTVTDKAELIIIKEHNALMVNGSQSSINDIEAIIKKLDHPIPQIFFKVIVVDFQNSNRKEFSIQGDFTSNNRKDRVRQEQWGPKELDMGIDSKNINKMLGKLGGVLKGVKLGKVPDDFYLRIKALEEIGKANIRSEPQISTLNGHKASLTIGQTRYFKLKSRHYPHYPYNTPNNNNNNNKNNNNNNNNSGGYGTTERFETIDINISLSITPWVSASGEITVEIHPVFSTPGEQGNSEIPPTINKRELTSTVRLRDGETIVLGGLIEEIDHKTIEQIPILGKIPLLGRLFRSTYSKKTKNELIIFVTPHLSNTDEWMDK